MILLMTPVWINGFPFVYYDTAFYLSYIESPILESELIFRPLAYSGFLKLSQSLFLAVALQCLWLNLLLFRTIRSIYSEEMNSRPWFYPMLILAAVTLTPITWYSNLMLPDIFLAIQFLSFIGILQSNENKFWKLFYLISLSISSTMHFSNLIIAVVLFFALIVTRSKKYLVVASLMPLILLPFLHGAIWKKWTMTNAHYFFLFSRLTALDISQEYLEEKCPTIKYKLCIVLENGFDPWNWSPTGTIGQFENTVALNSELRTVSLETLKQPKLAILFIVKSLFNGIKQIFLFSRPLENTMNDKAIKSFIEKKRSTEFEFFKTQKSQLWDESALNRVLDLFDNFYLITSFIALTSGLFVIKYASEKERKLIVYLVICLVLNSLICGALTEPHYRYQGRIFFLLPLFCFSMLFKNWKKLSY